MHNNVNCNHGKIACECVYTMKYIPVGLYVYTCMIDIVLLVLTLQWCV